MQLKSCNANACKLLLYVGLRDFSGIEASGKKRSLRRKNLLVGLSQLDLKPYSRPEKFSSARRGLRKNYLRLMKSFFNLVGASKNCYCSCNVSSSVKTVF